MRIALRELRRQPGRFLPVGGALTLLVILLVVLGGFLDGLTLVQTGAYRSLEGDVLVIADDVERQVTRSRVDLAAVDGLEAVDGVDTATPLELVPTTAGLPGADPEDELSDVILLGYGTSTDALPAPPAPGSTVVDATLGEVLDVGVGDTIAVGPEATTLVVDALVDDLTQGAPTVWVAAEQWRPLAAAANPAGVPPAGTAQALVVSPTDGTDPVALAEALDGVVPGLEAITPAQAIEALDVVQQQEATFQGIITVTFAVTLLVVALFFALITLERTALYAVLKAVGARSRDLLAGLSAQAVVISAAALALGIALSLGFASLLPPELPLRITPTRLALITGGTLVTALLGSLSTLRRILAIDPAEAIG